MKVLNQIKLAAFLVQLCMYCCFPTPANHQQVEAIVRLLL